MDLDPKTFTIIFIITLHIICGIVIAYAMWSERRKSGPPGKTELEKLLNDTRYDVTQNDSVGPQIAYKRANMLAGAPHEERFFKGVSGYVGYSPEETVPDSAPGFHAYKEFDKAKSHNQTGNVLLEVLLSGTVDEHKLGYTATNQRVLQVIADSCATCNAEAEYFVYEHALDTIVFICKKHYSQTRDIVNKDHRDSRIIERFENLTTVLPWLDEYGIVVSKQKGDHKFIPTTISEEQRKDIMEKDAAAKDEIALQDKN